MPPGNLGVEVVDTDVEAEDVSVSVVATCNNILEALKRDEHEALSRLITDVMPSVTRDEDYKIFTDEAAEVTFFVPPKDAAAGLLHAFEQEDLTAEQVLFCLALSWSLCWLHFAARFYFVQLLSTRQPKRERHSQKRERVPERAILPW